MRALLCLLHLFLLANKTFADMIMSLSLRVTSLYNVPKATGGKWLLLCEVTQHFSTFYDDRYCVQYVTKMQGFSNH